VATVAAALLVASALISAFAMARAVARRRVDAEVAKALDLAEARLADARGSESIDPAALAGATESARRAEALLESGGGPSLRPRAAALLSALTDAARDRKMVDDLDEARLLYANLKDSHFDYEAMHVAYLKAFRAYGVDAASLPIGEATSRVLSSPIRAALVAALDHWAETAPTNVPRERLAAIAAAADDLRNAPIRLMIARRDFAGLRALIGGESARRDAGAGLRAIFRVLMRDDTGPSLPLLQLVQREHPSDFWFSLDLGLACHDAKPPRLEEAIRYYCAAVALRPESPGLHNNLGNALGAKGEVDASIAELRRAVSIRLDYAEAHTNLGVALRSKGDIDAAIAAHRRAIAIRPDYANAHTNLGNALSDKGDLDAAADEYRRAIAIRPDYANAHTNLGSALRAKGDLDGAVAAHLRALAIRPDYAEAHISLGSALRDQGRFAEALESRRRGHELGSKRPDWRIPSARMVEESERHVALDARLPAILRGEAAARDAGDRIALADLCNRKSLHVASARFYGEAFATDAALAETGKTPHRYNAACAAALAGSGKGKDDHRPDDAARAGLRSKALGWLRDDLAAWSKILEGGNPKAPPAIIQQLAHWKVDTDLAGIRDDAELAKLPEAQRAALRSLWADVEALRKKAEEKAAGAK
jgi:tetratricopeptide (TPR) repeat protein